MATATDIDLEEFTKLLENYDDTPACEGTEHHTGRFGHITDEPAAYAMHWACPHCDYQKIVLQCAGRAQYIVSITVPVEIMCGHRVQLSECLVKVQPI